MDLYDEGFFIHIFGSFTSANLIFEIPSLNDRGNRELLMLSYIIDINNNINFDLSKELLKSFETEFKKISESYKAFYVDTAQFEGDQEKLEEIRSLFTTFYQTHPKESIIHDRKEAKILELGIIFSRWDEKLGAKIITQHPNDLFEDPEIIAIRCFSLSQYIFGGEDFKRNSVILPFIHLKVKAAIYFDYVQDKKVRGGRLPLSIMVFYNESIPRVIIDKFHLYIFQRFEKIKDVYTNQVKVLEELKEIHNNISKRMISFEPTIQATRIAEMRYQALFKAARDAILIIDRKSGIIVDANEQTEKLLQRPLEEIISLHANQLQLENNQNFRDRILMQLELENIPPIEIGLINQQKRIITIEVTTSEIQMGGQNLIQCILRDITERKLAEKQLQMSEAKFHNAYDEANLYKELFAHDFADLFNRIGLSVELLTQFQKRDYHKEEIVEIIKRFNDQTYEGNNIIKKARKLAEIEDSKKLIKKIELKKVLKEAIDSIKNDFQEKDIAIEINSTRDEYIVKANMLLFDAYENILINAIKYNENPQIKFEVKISDEIQNNITYVKMQFIDNSVGISEKKGKTVIQHNEARQSNGRGMLLGIILVDRIISSYNGRVWVEDKKTGESKQGSSFIVLIPEAK